MRYRTKEGDQIDQICWLHYGATAGVVERVLVANSGLARYGAVLPMGLVIELPELSITQESAPTVRLWD